MSSAFIQFAKRSFPPAAATVAATVLTATLYSRSHRLHRRNDEDEDQAAISKSADLGVVNVTSAGVCSVTRCEGAQQKETKTRDSKDDESSEPWLQTSDGKSVDADTVWGGKDGDMYHGLFPRRQLWKPKLEYPLWDHDWDNRHPSPESPSQPSQPSSSSRRGVTRHIILIRHGQYDETDKEDDKRILTPLGRKQAECTGKRLAELIQGVNEQFGPCNVKVVRVSDLARAKETADIICRFLPMAKGEEDISDENIANENDAVVEDVVQSRIKGILKAEPDPLLNEGRPCHTIPGSKARSSVIERLDEHHPRIERAFRKYFFRSLEDPAPSSPSSSPPSTKPSPDADQNTNKSNPQSASSYDKNRDDATDQSTLPYHPQHEFEIIVCHANVIRYFFCRALQLPPEAWLRLCIFNCSLTYFTIRPRGTVSCRMLGDIGHLPYELNTFSMHTGFNW